MRPPRWTIDEVTILRREYARRPARETAEMLGRNLQSVRQKANQLGLKGYEDGINWTPEMDKMLKDHFPTMFNEALAKWLGVSQSSLHRRARLFGLKKVDDFQERKAKELGRRRSASLKKVECSTRIKKGEHRGLETEFKKGHKNSPEQIAKAAAGVRRFHAVKKHIAIYGKDALYIDKIK